MGSVFRRAVKRKILYIVDRASQLYGRIRMRVVGGFRLEGGLARYRGAEQGNLAILEKLRTGTPVMVARYGIFELRAMVKGLYDPPWPTQSVLKPLCNNAGFFPARAELLPRFSEVYQEATRGVDIFCASLFRHGMWFWEEKAFADLCPEALLTDIRALDAFLYNDPWTAALEGRRVLVVHPFAKSIVRQYERREKLFSNPKILPRFGSLSVVPAVQSAAGSVVPFKDWFEALEFMQKEIKKHEFDVALIGAGAYGFPLAYFIKSLGKQAIHTGGVTQLLFGIMGKRWENWYPWLFNEHWIRPSLEERPPGADKVENACYW